ncbi:hypothetical protein D3C87_1700360 [compost metagenome]
MLKKLLVLLALTAGLSGCAAMRIEAGRSLDNQVYFTDVKGKTVDHFEESESVAFGFWGLTVLRPADPDLLLSKYVENGDSISNLRVNTERSFLDSMIGGLTLGIYQPWTVRYEGEVVRKAAGKKR